MIKNNFNSYVLLWIVFQIIITLLVHMRPDIVHGDFSITHVRALLTIQSIVSIPIYNRKLLNGTEGLVVYLFIPTLFLIGALNIGYIIYYSIV